MRITLLFVLAIATFGNCKKSHKKHAGYLIHKKGHKKSATYLKIQKPHWTAREAEPKQQGADYGDIDSLGNKWMDKEKKWMDTWDDFWEEIYLEAKNEKSKPKFESETEMGDWDILMDTLRGTNSTKKARIEEQKMKAKTREYIRFFIYPKHRRRGLKWVQTTTDTEEVFLAHTVVKNLHESMHNVREKEKKEKRPCDATYSCSWTTHATTEASTTTAGTQPPATTFNPDTLWPPLIKDRKEREKLNSLLGKELGYLTWKPKPPKKKDFNNADYSEEAYGSCNPRSR